MWIWALSAAVAAEPILAVDEAGFVTASMGLAVPVEDVAALLRDPAAIAAIDGTVQVSATPETDGCQRVHTVVPHPLVTVDYVARACPDGPHAWVYTFVEGVGIRAYQARWEVVGAPGGSELRYAVRTEPSLPLPRAVVNRSTRAAVEHTFARLAAHLQATGGPPDPASGP